MSRKLFGTDGVRGVANRDLTPELAFQLGQAAGRVLLAKGWQPRAVIGRDTRRSGPMLGAALGAGLCSVGVDVVAIGVAPTPTIAHIARTGDFGLGVVISASHNPAPDNGIKFIGHDGRKLPDEVEMEMEAYLGVAPDQRPEGAAVGSLQSDRADIEGYIGYLVSLVPERLTGLHVAVDTANGAAYELAVRVLEELGATVDIINDRPDGMNINVASGATHPQSIQDFTVRCGASVGVAFDGDADRAVFSDEKGRLVNGDRTIAIWSAHWNRHGLLAKPVVVGTVMSNGAYVRHMEQLGITVERAPVGDKYVAQRMRESGACVGGEQSGHVIFSDYAPTGDGLLTMLQLLRILVREGKPLSAFYDEFENWPQLLINVSVADRVGWNQGPAVTSALEIAEQRLAGRGRMIVRASGTQPMVRVMVEADEAALRDEVSSEIVAALESEAAGKVYSKVDLTYALGD
ncbi:MAG: phosphoglucosamine mutase [Fimbriimonadaceae bacterium]